MRAALAVCLLFAVGCTSPTGQSSQSPSNSRRPVLASGGVIEYAVPEPAPQGAACVGCGRARLSAIAAGADQNLWFVDIGHRAVGRITPAGAVTEFDVSGTASGTAGTPAAIAASPDGNIWLTACGSGQGPDWIVRVSPAGDFMRFQVGSQPGGQCVTGAEGITAGPDGNIWFTEHWANRVGRLTPRGVLTEFPIPTNESYPAGIVSGPDGNLWFAESNHRAIGRITLTGQVTEYALDRSPTSIVAGPDGNLWFTAAAPAGKIGRITPTGAITLFPLLREASAPAGMAVGPDGNLWFTDPGANAVVRITPSGAIREFRLPRRGSDPVGIAAGSDGRIWFTEAGVSRIASIGVTVPEATLSSRVLNFGAASGPTTRTVTVTNSGDGPMVILSVRVAGSDQAAFTVTGDTCSGKTVLVQGNCQVVVTFGPGSGLGLDAARLELADNATATPQVVSLVAQLADCRLPIVVGFAAAAQGEFLSLPSGDVTADPNSGQSPVTYDRSLKRWLPVGRSAISPDGSRYAYAGNIPGPDWHLHVVDVATGGDRTLSLPSGGSGFWGVLEFAREGIYVQQAYGGGQMVSRELPSDQSKFPLLRDTATGSFPFLLVDPDTGAMRQVFADAAVQAVADGAAWIGLINPADPHPAGSPMGMQFPDELVSRDLATGETTTWLYRPGASLDVVAVAGGRVLVRAGGDQEGYLILRGPNQTDALMDPETGDALPLTGGLAADAQGLWLGSLDGIYLWTSHTGAALVFEVVATPAGSCA